MTLWQRWKKVSINNKLMIYMTFILAAATTLYTLMYRSQVKFMEQSAKENAEQTSRLVNASERLADTTRNTLDEAKRVNREASERADSTLKATEKQADASMSQANTSKVTANAAEESARIAQIGLLPRIETVLNPPFIFEPGKMIRIDVQILNKGNSSALNCTSDAHLMRFNRPLARGAVRPRPSTTPSVGNIAPNSNFLMKVSGSTVESAEFNSIIAGKRELRLWIVGRYDTEFGGRNLPFAFCWAWNVDLKALVVCSREEYEESYPHYKPN